MLKILAARPNLSSSALQRYVTAALLTAIAWGLALPLAPLVDPAHLLLLLGAVVLSGWHGGRGPGLLAVSLAVPAIVFLLPGDAWTFTSQRDFMRLGVILVIFPAVALGAAYLSATLRRLRQARSEAEAARAFLEAVLHQMPAGVVIAEAPSGRVLQANRQVEAIAGQPFPSAASTADYQTYQGFHPDGQSYRPEEWPLSRSISRGETVMDEEVEIPGDDGARMTVLVSSAPVCDAQGRIIAGVVTFREITERKRAEEALREADRQKDEFLAVLAHELRNPLAPIQNAVEIMRRLGVQDSDVQWARDVVDHQVAHMKRLLDDLLDIARITQGRITLQQERLEVTGIIDQAVEVARPVIDERGHDFNVSAPARPLYVEGDLTRLAQVLSNLLNNAAKYTPEGGRITLTAKAVGQEVAFRIRDTGVGIPPDLLPHVFDALTLGGKAPHGKGGGLGLGLKLVRSLVEMHGGRVEAHSDGPGQGSEFVVWLPQWREALATEAAKPEAAPSDDGSQRAGQGHRVLVVEDQPDTAKTMSKLLELEGFEVQIAPDGLSALEVSRTFRPQAIILDIGLPDMDGYQVAHRLRAQPETKHSRIVALSGYGQYRDTQRSREAGCDDHLVKPANLEALIKALRPAPFG